MHSHERLLAATVFASIKRRNPMFRPRLTCTKPLHTCPEKTDCC